MELPRDAVLLRMFVGEDDKTWSSSTLRGVVAEAREMNLAGATVLRGPMGFGHTSHIHTTKILPRPKSTVVVEIVDSQTKMDTFLPVLYGMMSSGLVTRKVQVLQYGANERASELIVQRSNQGACVADADLPGAIPRRSPPCERNLIGRSVVAIPMKGRGSSP